MHLITGKCHLKYVFATVLFLACGKVNPNFEIRVTPPNRENEFKGQIKSLEEFSYSFVNTYRKMIQEKINPAFQDSIPLNKGHVRIEAILSSSKEAFLNAYSSEIDIIDIYCTDFNAQFKLMSGMKFPDSTRGMICDGEILTDVNSVNSCYDETDAFFTVKTNAFGFILPLHYVAKKVANIEQKSFLVFIDSSSIISKLLVEREITEIYNLGILSGDKDFKYAKANVEVIAWSLLNTYIDRYSKTSELFLKAMAHPELAEVAQDIAMKFYLSDSLRLYDVDYPPWRQEMDINYLRNLAVKYGIIDSNYCDVLIRHEMVRQRASYLLWNYRGNVGYMIQWAFPPAILFVFLIVITITGIPKAITSRMILIGTVLNTASMAWYGYAFSERPASMIATYWLLPSVVTLISIVLLGYLMQINKNQI